MKEVKPKKDKGLKTKIIIANLINVLLVIALIYILNRLPSESQKVKQLRSEQVLAQESVSAGVINAEVASYQSKIDTITNVFVDEQGFIDFVTSIEQIRAQGVLTEISFPVSDPVEDKNGYLGLPVSLVFRGDINQINSNIDQVNNLPFLLKTVSSNIEDLSDGTFRLQLGLFLYVHEEFNNN